MSQHTNLVPSVPVPCFHSLLWFSNLPAVLGACAVLISISLFGGLGAGPLRMKLPREVQVFLVRALISPACLSLSMEFYQWEEAAAVQIFISSS